MKVIKHIILIIILVICNNAFAQKQNNQWRFGFGASIDFNTIPPSFPSGAALPTLVPPLNGLFIEGTASIADRLTGDLLFYTDGQTVWNAQNQPMPNGSELAGNTYLSSIAGAVIVPVPQSCSKYYIFTAGDPENGYEGLKYSVVDMELNNGLGDIISGQKSIFLYQNQSQCINVYPKSTQDGYWVLTGDESGLGIAAFEVNASGIDTIPVISQINTDAINFRINPQGTKLVTIYENITYGISLYNFDAATGIVSDPIDVPFVVPNDLLKYFEFSPNGQYLYATSDTYFYQFDITSNNVSAIQASATLITFPFTGSYGMPQIGPNGKLYVVYAPFVYEIENPNNPAASIGPITQLPTNVETFVTLPQWIYVLPDDGPSASIVNPSELCLQDSIPFSLQSASGIVSITWNFDDPNSGNDNTSSLVNPTHLFSDTGTFSIQCIITLACSIDTIVKNLTINSLPVVNITTQFSGCDNSSGSATANVSQGSPEYSYVWSPGGSTSVSIDSLPVGDYSVIVSDANGCTASGTGSVGIAAGPQISVVPENATITAGDSIQLTASGGLTYVWSPASGLSCTDCVSPIASPSDTTTYTVTGFDAAGCVDTALVTITVEERCDEVFIPTIFSPNGKGPQANETFCVFSDCVEQFKLVIHNRWGEKVFETEDISQCWDGTFKGAEAASGVYAFNVYLKQLDGTVLNKIGNINLIR
jgi:gliding motility-associated-like protein